MEISRDTKKRLLWVMFHTGKSVDEVINSPELIEWTLSDNYKEPPRLNGNIGRNNSKG